MPKETKPAFDYEIHPAASNFPMMTRSEFDELKEDIKTNGQRVPILKKGKIILDGRNRLAVCEDLGIKPIMEEYEGMDIEGEIISRNLARRNLTDDQKAAVIVKFKAPAIQAEAKERKTGKGVDKKKGAKVDKPKTSTKAEVASAAGVSQHVAGQLLDIQKSDPKKLDQIIEGKTTAAAAAKEVKASKPKKEKVKKPEPTLLEQVGKDLARIIGKYPLTAHREVKEIIKLLVSKPYSEIDCLNALQKEVAKRAPKPDPKAAAEAKAAEKEKAAPLKKSVKDNLAAAKKSEKAQSAKPKTAKPKKPAGKGKEASEPPKTDSDTIFG